ncbi:MAG: hypothetical protein ACI8QS_002472 [Planctomycetota bacterium]|jgi:hypothetical protein
MRRLHPFSILLAALLPLIGGLPVAQEEAQQGGGFGGIAGDDGFPGASLEDRGLGSTHGPRTLEEDENIATFSWRIWWDVSQEHYLARRAHIHGELPWQEDEGFYLGRGEKPQVPRPALKLSPEVVAEKVLPLFILLLEKDRIPEVQAATLIAYARAARTQPSEARIQVVDRIRPFLADSSRDVSEAATIALGISAHFSAIVTLGDLLAADEAGQQLIDDSEVPFRQRTYAAYALALAASDIDNEDVRRYAVQKLSSAARDDSGRWSELEVACLIGMGMLPLADDGSALDKEGEESQGLTTLSAQLSSLLRIAVDPDEGRLARSHAATSIGRLVMDLPPPRREAFAAELVPPLAEILKRGTRAPREAMQGAALALGSLIDDDDDEASDVGRRALTRVFDLHDDTLTQAFALLSLGRAAGREGLGREPGVGAAEARTFLLAKLTRGSTVLRTWAAISLGVHCYDLRTQDREIQSEVRSALREALKRTDSPEELSAYATAVGLAGDLGAAERLSRKGLKAQNDFLRGHVSVALGMTGAKEYLGSARASFFSLRDRPATVERASLGRALLDDPDLVRDLERILEAEGSLKGREAMLFALGRFGDVRALDTLLSWAQPRAASSELRSVAVAALGMLCEPDAVPWPSRIGWQVNAYARTETLRGSGRGVLDAR